MPILRNRNYRLIPCSNKCRWKTPDLKRRLFHRYAACMGENKGHCTTIVQSTSESAVTRVSTDSTTTASTDSTTTANEKFQVQFLNMLLDLTETSVALYTQFVVVLSLACFLLFLVILFFRSPAKYQKDFTSVYSTNVYTSNGV